MNNLNIFFNERKHFFRNPFKIVAVLLFVIAGVYGLYNGRDLYQNQKAEIEKIQKKTETDKQKYLIQFQEGNLIDENRPWIDMSTPYWAIWNTPTYQIKEPSPALVFSIGQAEQYGFYKRITFWASPYDSDMAEEIANPERLQTGTLDFTFVLLFLLPLLLLILLYNIKSAETEQGFLTLIEVQTASKNGWLIARISFYFLFTYLVIVGLSIYGALLTDVFTKAGNTFNEILLYAFFYLLFWSVFYFFILKSGKTILGVTLQMVGVWLLFAFIIPAIVHQSISIAIPANLMTDFIEVRDKEEDLYADDSLFQQNLFDLFPSIINSPVYQDSAKKNFAFNYSAAALVNQLKRESIQPIEDENREKNNLIQSTFWFNPVSFFQNKFNSIAATHFSDYWVFRQNVQKSIDERIQLLLEDMWNDVKVDMEKYLEYNSNNLRK